LANIMIGREASLRKVACEQPGGWGGFKPFRVARKVPESTVMTSFVLEPEDGMPLPQFSPGQYVSVKVRPPGLGFDQIRQYSLSATANGHQFRISVKREDAPAGSSGIRPGTVSNYLHNQVQEGDTVLVHMPGGENVLDERSTSPVVLMSGGAGITAVLGMLEYLATDTDREVLWLHAARSRGEDSFGAAVRALEASRDGVRCLTLYEKVRPDDVQGKDFDVVGRINVELLRAHLPAGDPEFYYCGPIGFMVATERVLDQLGVPLQCRHSEAFAPDESFIVSSPL
jgi:nitric oxide dioxygenase